MKLVNELEMKSKDKRDIREQIWDLLKGKGFSESSHSSKILKKEIEISNPDSSPGVSKTMKLMMKYKFGANNLQMFSDDFKNYSIPFCRLTIVDGEITKKK